MSKRDEFSNEINELIDILVELALMEVAADITQINKSTVKNDEDRSIRKILNKSAKKNLNR